MSDVELRHNSEQDAHLEYAGIRVVSSITVDAQIKLVIPCPNNVMHTNNKVHRSFVHLRICGAAPLFSPAKPKKSRQLGMHHVTLSYVSQVFTNNWYGS